MSVKRRLSLRARPVFGFIPIRGTLAHVGTALLGANLRKRSVGAAVDVVLSHAHELGMTVPLHKLIVSPSEILVVGDVGEICVGNDWRGP